MIEPRTRLARGCRGAACALLVTAALLPGLAGRARADWGDAGADSVYLVGEFVDPVCIFQHGMQGTLQRQCALVRGRVDQGMWFLDIRHRRLYAVIGQTHWQDPRRGFLESLGDTRSEEHTSELQSPCNLVCRLLLEKKKKYTRRL